MKIKKELEAVYEESPPSDLSQKIQQAAHREMNAAKAREQSSWNFSWLWQPALGLAVAAAVFAFYQNRPTTAPTYAPPVAFGINPEMVRDAEMLANLKLLRQEDLWEQLEKKKWPKKGS